MMRTMAAIPRLPVLVMGWFAPLAWPVKVSAEARYEWWLMYDYANVRRGFAGPWDTISAQPHFTFTFDQAA